MSYTDRIRLLKLYTMALPDALPMEQPDDKINKLLGFELDAEWVASIGELAAVNRELENAIWGYGGPRSDDGIFKITTRGPAIQNLADILEYWLAKYPDAFQLQKWLQDATASASAIILAHKKPLPLLDAAPSGKPKKSSSGKQSTLTGDFMKEKKQKKKKGPDERPSVKKPDTKKLVDTSDPSFDSASEGEDDRTGGRKIDPLLLKISKPCSIATGKNFPLRRECRL
ncbi:hypothetical protein B0H13DRAFT_2319895 [Mycena leptocephala]|nr:hypothetical protein B0H13DRAFT_2319895 [Mycena leptocephala]